MVNAITRAKSVGELLNLFIIRFMLLKCTVKIALVLGRGKSRPVKDLDDLFARQPLVVLHRHGF